MLRIAHIVKPMIAPEGSEHAVAQPITFETMRRAKAAAKDVAVIEHWATCFPNEQPAVPPDFRSAAPLKRSVGDIASFRIRRPLPIFRDVLERLYDASQAEYFIYTNVDIALQPHFYTEVVKFIAQGYDAFTINRRTLPGHYSRVDQIPAMCAEPGTAHPGYDCFVFRRDAYESFVLGDVCLGCGHVDLPLVCSMIAAAKKFTDINDAHLTFHIGDSRAWWKWKYRDYIVHNDTQAKAALLEQLRRRGLSRALRPHIRALLSVPLLKNSMLVGEWKRLFGHTA
ncbi:MAG TPA: hypothetical protein PKV72_03480 [Candidatus Peribacteria bacterium]|nr:hypothetical protein [Candidatus Peribacteria bacterium]